ncbi:uncharacterized protein YndB with AHSA1/START domain [Streptacidiphilus sp. MAP12-20]|uniref:SRPBCC family protein n=1 Tax=Streptacidiphilus sp. MAP12-20 TaxID=3156299 RepID=UPI003511E17D
MSKTQITAEPGVPLIVMECEFDAPRDLVFRAYIEPDLMARWVGPRYLTTTVDRWEARDGGRWRFVQQAPDGSEYGFHGVFHGDASPQETVRTFEFEGVPGHVALETLTMTELEGGRTRVRTLSCFQAVQDRDAAIASGMESGVREGEERLRELLASLQG